MEKKNRKSDENISLQDVDVLTGQSLVHAADGAELAAHGAGVAVVILGQAGVTDGDRKSTRLNSSHRSQSRMPSSA